MMTKALSSVKNMTVSLFKSQGSESKVKGQGEGLLTESHQKANKIKKQQEKHSFPLFLSYNLTS